MCLAKGCRSALLLVSVLAAVAPAAGSCADQPLPGTVYGMYKVTGTTTTNTCGSGLGAPDPWVFDAQISRDGDTLYWSWMDGSAPVSGPLSGESATLSTNESANVDSTDAGLGPCTMTRADSLTLTLASGSPPSTFSGTIGYAFTVVSGSTCGDQLTSAGGTYATLPCSIAYSVTAAIQ
jgi:hypothetical protein